ncbi:gas vesicle protein GvpJ [Natronosalvus halobius]|uniref:gas vesicle protein GvpJ n=1 Tax=Natronosalvus halobius TaxID=2953746 RepID=UPI00209EC22C|nr:gas vesicle protein [Natronosalvus halobius]USZ73263.1 gas vesicle protein [Natronosalvus halobius]
MVDAVQPSRQQADLADVVEMLLDKGIVINADIAVSIGDTQLLGIQLRAAIASFETAAKYGLEFPEGTDMRRVAEAAGEPELAEEDRRLIPPVAPVHGVNVTGEDDQMERSDADDSSAADATKSDEDELDDDTDGSSGGDTDDGEESEDEAKAEVEAETDGGETT